MTHRRRGCSTLKMIGTTKKEQKKNASDCVSRFRLLLRFWIWSCPPTLQNGCFSHMPRFCRPRFKLCITVRFCKHYKSNSDDVQPNTHTRTCTIYCVFRSDPLPFWDPLGHATVGGPHPSLLPGHPPYTYNIPIILSFFTPTCSPPLPHSLSLSTNPTLLYAPISPLPFSFSYLITFTICKTRPLHSILPHFYLLFYQTFQPSRQYTSAPASAIPPLRYPLSPA